jgi:transcriptional regulator with XRE-family HTH domain
MLVLNFGRNLLYARVRAGLSQLQLAKGTGLHQSDISQMEQGKRLPSFAQLLDLAKRLEVSLQYLLTGSNYPATELPDLEFQLRELGIADLHVEDTRVPGAFIHDEEAIVLALVGNSPQARIIEAIPAVLAWNAMKPRALHLFADLRDPRVKYRLAWLADIAITIHQGQGFPGGCPNFSNLETFISKIKPPTQEDAFGISREVTQRPPPVTLRWKMGYPAQLAAFRERAERLNALNDAELHRRLRKP